MADPTDAFVQSRIINCLRTARGRVVTHRDLVDACYYDRADGGPLGAISCLYRFVHILRYKGFPIINRRGVGYLMGWREWEVRPLAARYVIQLPRRHWRYRRRSRHAAKRAA